MQSKLLMLHRMHYSNGGIGDEEQNPGHHYFISSWRHREITKGYIVSTLASELKLRNLSQAKLQRVVTFV